MQAHSQIRTPEEYRVILHREPRRADCHILPHPGGFSFAYGVEERREEGPAFSRDEDEEPWEGGKADAEAFVGVEGGDEDGEVFVWGPAC